MSYRDPETSRLLAENQALRNENRLLRAIPRSQMLFVAVLAAIVIRHVASVLALASAKIAVPPADVLPPTQPFVPVHRMCRSSLVFLGP